MLTDRPVVEFKQNIPWIEPVEFDEYILFPLEIASSTEIINDNILIIGYRGLLYRVRITKINCKATKFPFAVDPTIIEEYNVTIDTTDLKQTKGLQQFCISVERPQRLCQLGGVAFTARMQNQIKKVIMKHGMKMSDFYE